MEKEERQDKRTKVYELGFLLIPSIAEENLGGEVQNIKAAIEKYNGTFITEDFPKLRPLAYTMQKASNGSRGKFEKAYFGWIKFEIEPVNVGDLKSIFAKNDSILRSMIIETVRENTLMSQRVVFKTPAEAEKARKEEGAAPVSEEELDKTIENLVVE